jgi:MoxR-like ATPase
MHCYQRIGDFVMSVKESIAAKGREQEIPALNDHGIDAELGKALTRDHFAAIGAYGFHRSQIAILASLVTEDPLLLIGRSGTGKTYLLNSISEALGLTHRHYNASLIAFDDLVGFPYPDDARESVRFLETPATIWGAESVLVDEISRCKPEHQNRLFSLVHERRIQGIALESLRYRWAAMNPSSADQDGSDAYLGSEPLDPALADRFSIIVEVGDWEQLSEKQQQQISDPGGEGFAADDGGQLRGVIAVWRELFLTWLAKCPRYVTEYARIITSELNASGVRISPRRARLLSRSLLAATAIEGGPVEKSYRTVLESSLPQRAWGEPPEPEKIMAAHRLAWNANLLVGDDKWVNSFHLKRTLLSKVRSLAENCPSQDAGTLAVEQLLANETPERAAAFALAAYPAAIQGKLPIGADGLNDLGNLASELLSIDGELSWQERLGSKKSSHAGLTELSVVLDRIQSDRRRSRARQLFYWALLNKVPLEHPNKLEADFHATVEYLAGRGA